MPSVFGEAASRCVGPAVGYPAALGLAFAAPARAHSAPRAGPQVLSRQSVERVKIIVLPAHRASAGSHEPAGPPQGRIPECAARRYSSDRRTQQEPLHAGRVGRKDRSRQRCRARHRARRRAEARPRGMRRRGQLLQQRRRSRDPLRRDPRRSGAAQLPSRAASASRIRSTRSSPSSAGISTGSTS